METKDFFSLRLIRNKFSSDSRNAVQHWIEQNHNIDQVTPGSAAIAMLLMSLFENQDDLANYADTAVNVEIRSTIPERVVDVLDHILQDELNANCVERIIFNRSTASIHIVLINGVSESITTIPAILKPTWNSEAVVIWNRMELINLANELMQESHMGELVTDLNEYMRNFNEN